MLVLNTNNGGGGGYKISNEQIMGGYPNFENALLLTFPIGHNDNFYSMTNTETPAININGTKIHRFCKNIVAPQFFTIYKPLTLSSSNQLGYPPINLTSPSQAMSNLNYTLRFGLPTQMKGGEIIGKEIITPEILTTNSGVPSITITYKIGLLHSDGTISYIGTHTGINTASAFVEGYSSGGSRGTSQATLYKTNTLSKVITTNGVEAQLGDYLIFELIFASTSSSTSGIQYGFGSPYPINEHGIQYPIQVSID